MRYRTETEQGQNYQLSLSHKNLRSDGYETKKQKKGKRADNK